jgi:hypothetical protein
VVRRKPSGRSRRPVGDHLVVADDDRAPLAQRQLEDRAELLAPLLELQVHARRVDLQQVAEDGQAARAGQVVELAQRGRQRGGGS